MTKEEKIQCVMNHRIKMAKENLAFYQKKGFHDMASIEAVKINHYEEFVDLLSDETYLNLCYSVYASVNESSCEDCNNCIEENQ